MNFLQSYCFDCGKRKIFHLESWIDNLVGVLPHLSFFSSKKINNFLDVFLEKFLKFLNLAHYEKIENVQKINIPLGIKSFLKEIKDRGGEVFVLKSVFGYTINFLIKYQNKKIKFFGLPLVEFLNPKIYLIDNKIYVKKVLSQNSWPTPEGKIFWFWQKNKAIKYSHKLGWPVVVKPTNGSVARHITLNIQNDLELKSGINKALEYSPSFIIEKFIKGDVFRATIVDFKKVFCVKQVPANVVGDGISSISKLIEIKNSNPERGNPHDKNYTLYKILINETSKKLLEKQGYTLKSIPQKGKIIYLQESPFLRLGGDLVEVTEFVHPENKKMFLEISKLFNIRLVGIDFVAQDISVSWQKQVCGILELNTLPSIELHIHPSSGKPQNISEALIDLLKYY